MDSFHYIGTAESSDLIHWVVINGINNPIASVTPATLSVDLITGPSSAASAQQVTIPADTPVVGYTLGWFAGRVYAPSGTILDNHDLTVVFAGYHTQKPKSGLGNDRTIGRVSLHSSQPLGDWSDDGDSR